ncbi:MAG: tetratricopeptide repeat protein, partial [Woeseiaceae bacterium]|nr:tetratricopeptide repeat protein [Woeseiaceae bacterium]
MWLQRFTEWLPVRLTLLVVILAMAGCASSGSKPAVSDRGQGKGVAAGADLALDIPAPVLTLYEQAVAVMASGDFLDAELRLKEFLLQYPGYPGAYVNLAIIHVNNEDELAAQAAIDAALGINPDYAPALNQQGMLLRKNGKFLEAEAAYLKAVTA